MKYHSNIWLSSFPTADITFHTNDPVMENFVLSVKGKGVHEFPTITLTQKNGHILKSGIDTIHFRKINQKDQHRTMELIMQNSGLVYLSNLDYQIHGKTFAVEEPYEGMLSYNQKMNVTLEFFANETGHFSGTLEISSNDPLNSPFVVYLVGEADIVNSINEFTDNEFQVYPNPVWNNLEIETSMSATVYMYAVSGTMIYNGIIDQKGIIQMTNFEKGIYILKMINDKGIKTVKVVKK